LAFLYDAARGHGRLGTVLQVASFNEEKAMRSTTAVPRIPRGASPEQRRVTVHAYELRIRGLDSEFAFALARWDLLSCHEVRELVRLDGGDRFLVLYEGDCEASLWCHLLGSASYPATPVGQVDEPEVA
jgi:hypothetical protein